jgi:pimeloyl-ACP methyl ester carboxylesterase
MTTLIGALSMDAQPAGDMPTIVLVHGAFADASSWNGVVRQRQQQGCTTERGHAGLAADRRELARLIWRFNSPAWTFDDAAFGRTAASFDNPDYVPIVIHNDRWRLALAAGDPRNEALEQQLAEGPVIPVPAITLDGDSDSDSIAPATDGASYVAQFSGKYTHRVVPGAGHNLPQESPQAFADAVVEIDGY